MLNATTAALLLLLGVLLVAALSSRIVAVAASLAAFVAYNYFFLPPVGTLTIADPQNWAAFLAFVYAALIASQLSTAAQKRAREAEASRREAELVRQRADFADTLLASLSHDLRTPVTAIRVAISNLDAPTMAAGDRREQVRLAQGELARLTRMFDGILEMARVDALTLAPEREWVTPLDVIDAALANLQPELAERPLTVAADETHAAHIDPRLVSAALGHLIENAAQYSPAGSPLELEGRIEAAGLRLVVSDRGSGLDPSEMESIFDRFTRGRREHVRSGGTGMGLAITRGLLAVLGGRVWAENRADGGARFSITVPAATRAVPTED